MLKVENIRVDGFQEAIRGVRNSYNSWEKSDSGMQGGNFVMGNADKKLLSSLVKAGDSHAKAMRMITVWFDVTAPRMWWTEFDTYKHTVRCSCSTIHTLASRDLSVNDFSCTDASEMQMTVDFLNDIRKAYVNDKTERNWRRLKEQLPESFNQTATICTNYQTLRNMYLQRKGHKLKEWNTFRIFIECLPYAKELITI